MNSETPRKRRPSSIDGFVSTPQKLRPLTKAPIKADNQKPPATATKKPQLRPAHPIEDDVLNEISASEAQSSDSILNRNLVKDLKQPIKKPKKKRSKRKIILLSVLAIFIFGIGGGIWDVWQLYHKVHHIQVGNLTASVGGAENILVAGSTNRCNLKVQNAEWGFCSDGVTGVNSDVIFIIHVVPSTHTVSLLSIPRDIFVPNARSGNQAFKIDAALYEGPTQLVQAVEEDFGIPIQHYVEVGFDGFVNIVNAIGGIKMNFPEAVYDSESYLNVPTPGCYLMNGVQALQVVRARHLQYKAPGITTTDHNYWPQETESDIARISRTHEFLRVLANSVAATGISNPITDQKLIDAMAPQVQVDSGFSLSAMLDLMQDFHSANFNTVPQLTLPIVTTGFGSYDYEGSSYGDVVFPYENSDEQIIDKFLGETSSTNTMTGKPLPAAKSISVNVINGSGVSNQAETISSGLQSLGFNIASQPSSARPVSYQAQETVVNYMSQKDVGEALAVAKDLSGYVIISQNAKQVSSGSQVTVVTGTGASVDTASPSSSNTSTSASSSTKTASTSSSSSSTSTSATSSLGPISSATQALAAWDPVACSSGQHAIVDSKL